MDRLSKERRSWNMSRISGRDTKPELAVRRALHAHGYRFRLYQSGLPGRPDIVLPKWETVIFVHGCFWHRHSGCMYSYSPKTRAKFWSTKFEQNILRDRRNRDLLASEGWRVEVIWECEAGRAEVLNRLILRLFSRKKEEPGSRNLCQPAKPGARRLAFRPTRNRP